MEKLEPHSIRKILIRSANWIGDSIMTTPVIRGIRKNFPHSNISILAKPWVAPVFENNPFIDKILIYDNLKRHNGIIGIIRLAKDLKRHKFDLAVLMQNAFEAAFISFLSGIPYRLGYNTDARGVLLSKSIKLNPSLKKGHIIDYYLGILKGACLPCYSRTIELFISDQEKADAYNRLASYNVISDNMIIGINPGAEAGTAKRWFPERYADLCARLIKKSKNIKILIFGSAKDYNLGQTIAKHAGNKNIINICGKTSLRQAFALIECCNLFITNDSGLMHAAAALNITQIAIIGSTDHIATGPSNSNSRLIKVPTSCAPCLKPECRFEDHACMKAISVDMVYNAALEALD